MFRATLPVKNKKKIRNELNLLVNRRKKISPSYVFLFFIKSPNVMSILTSRFVLPIYLLAIFYYFVKFFFIFTVIFTCLIICSSASAIKIPNTGKFPSRLKHEDLKGGSIKAAHYTNTWVSEIQGESYAVQKILERQGYVVLDEVSFNHHRFLFIPFFFFFSFWYLFFVSLFVFDTCLRCLCTVPWLQFE